MKILLIGQCTLHWGRMEFGNIGNYYIIEPFIRELHRVFPNAAIRTTFQMSEDFCNSHRITVLPMELFYSWKKKDLDIALIELASAQIFTRTKHLPKTTPFINAVLESDLIIDLSGDIWGDNANLVGANRLLVGLIKDRVAQLLGKPTAMLAGSPGPFSDKGIKKFAREVYANFDLVTNRETASTAVLKKEGFDIARTKNCACPAFLFEGSSARIIRKILCKEGLTDKSKPHIGFIVCGWNFARGPFDTPDRKESDYAQFVETIEYISNNYGAKVFLMSHANAFPVPPADFQLLHGRDYPIIKQLQVILDKRGVARNVAAVDGIYDPRTTKAIIGTFDLLISGRLHGAVAGLSQFIPTVLIDYGHAPRAHKIKGFAKIAGVEEYVANPSRKGDLILKVTKCWENREALKKHLKKKMPLIKQQAQNNFIALKTILR